MRQYRRRSQDGDRFDLTEICRRISSRMADLGIEAKEVYGALGISKGNWSNKINNAGSTLTIPEISIIADILEALPGWPFISQRQAELLATEGAEEPRQRPKGTQRSPQQASSGAANPRKRAAGGGR